MSSLSYHHHESQITTCNLLPDEHVWTVGVYPTLLVKQVFDGLIRRQDNHGFGTEDERVDWSVGTLSISCRKARK